MVNLLTERSNVLLSTCGPLQSIRTFSSAAGETLPSDPTMRTRTSAKPDCPLSGKVKVNLPVASAAPFSVSAPDSSRTRAPGEAVPLTAIDWPQTADPRGVRTGAVVGALDVTVNPLVYSVPRGVPARFFAAVVTRSV